ncbi:hypothetical protein [Streptomyces sp. NPDC002209]|uniref:hypothetical protein n=1 Tax=Streptomyces sp. NPDC002209 TaxID=3364638 RepID=UPI0036BCAD9C
MNSTTWSRRIVRAAATVTLIGGGAALPATAMAAPTAPQHTAAQAPHNDNQDTPNSSGGTVSGDSEATGVTAKSLNHIGPGDQIRKRTKVIDPDGDVYISPDDRKAAIGDDIDKNIDDDFAADPDDYLLLKSLGINPDHRDVDADDSSRTDFPEGDLDQ